MTADRCAEWLRARGDRLAAWVLLQTTESLVHAAALEPPTFAGEAELEDGVARAVLALIAA